MIQRVIQFFRAVFAAGPNTEEQNIINSKLPSKGVAAFYAMTIADQRHSLNVMYSSLELCKKVGLADSCTEMLIRCSLLHDIGKGPGFGKFRKTYCVLLNHFCKIWAQKMGQADSRNFLHNMLYRYYQHPAISSSMLKDMGLEEEAAVVALHHSEEDDLPPELSQILQILKKADSIN